MYKSKSEIQSVLQSGDIDNIAYLLDGSDYDQGKLEDLERTVGNTQKFCAKLALLLLSNKGVCTEEEIVELFHN